MEKLFEKLFNESVPRSQALAAYKKLVPALLGGSSNKQQFLFELNRHTYQKLKKDFKWLKKVTKLNKHLGDDRQTIG